MPDAQVVVGTLADIAPRVREAGVQAPALLIVGDVVARRVIAVSPSEALIAAATG
jgi:precorrin-4 methylase